MPKVIRVWQGKPALKPKKKVAAYARVSVESERMHHSLSAQVSYYNALIQKNPEWQFAGVFADYGISGTGMEKREDFLRMLEAAENGEIDIILTKSIQRFARNTVDLLETVRHLKDIGVEVRFEKEHISSMSTDGELMLTILASFAEEESRSISENIKWAIRKRFRNGVPGCRFNVYGYRWEDDAMVIVPEEAEIVRRIYQDYLDGKMLQEIVREFTTGGITTRNGFPWSHTTLRQILSNVTYTGNLLLQKGFVADPISKRRKTNCGQLPKFFVEDTHPAIIDKETFDHIQEEMARRKTLGVLANKTMNTCCFTGKLKCPHCGKNYIHGRYNGGNTRSFWVCGSGKKAGGKCPVGGSINQSSLQKASAEVLGLEVFDETVFLEKVDYINVPERNVLEYHLKDGMVISKDCPNTGYKDSWTAERRAEVSAKRKRKPHCYRASVLTGKIRCAHCGCNFHRATQPSATLEGGKAHYWRCTEKQDGCNAIGFREDVLKPLIANVLGLDEYDEDVFIREIDYIEADGRDLHFRFHDGHEVCRVWEKKSLSLTEKFMEAARAKMTPEHRQRVSENMKRIWKERRAQCSKEK